MKLLNLTNLYYIVFSLVFVLLANTYITYRVIHYVDHETKEHMLFEKEKVIEQLNNQPFLQNITIEIGDLVSIKPVPLYNVKADVFKDTSFLDPKEYESVPFLQLTFQTMANGHPYEIKIRRRLTEEEDVFNGIFISFMVVGAGIILLYLVFNAWFSGTKLKPFYHALDQLQKFEVGRKNELHLIDSSIFEFKSLNNEIKKLTDKANHDYQNLKEFTENVSHETRTPIAVVQARLETLLQSSNLTEVELKNVSLALDSIHRLTEKNNSLILLSRIDNSQYASIGLCEVNLIAHKILAEMTEFISAKKLTLTKNIKATVLKNVSPALIEILISNLISNAIRYNQTGGEIKIICTPNYLNIINTSNNNSELPSNVISRYVKGDHPDSTGLGLAIVRKICLLYKFELSYTYKNGMHYFSVIFNSN